LSAGRRPTQESPTATVEMRATKDDVRSLSRAQKRATLLTVILSAAVAEADLDGILKTATALMSKLRG